MSDAGQSGAEALDDAQLGADEAVVGDEPAIDHPPERPLGVDEPQVADDGVEDSLEERLAREEPDIPTLPEVGDVPVLADDGDGDAMTADAATAGAGDAGDRPAEERALPLEPQAEPEP